MSKTRAILGFIVLLIFISAIVILNESIVITEPHLQLTLSKYYFAGGAFLVFVAFIFILVFNNRPSFVNWKAFLLISLGYLGPIVATIIQPETISFVATDSEGVAATVTLVIGLYARFQSLFYAMTSLLMTYLMFVVVPKLLPSKRFLMGFLYLLAIILTGLIIYSVIVEWDQYYLLYTTGDIDYYSPTISLFSNTNVFGYYLSLGIFALGILESLKHRFWHYAWMLVFLVSLLLTITITSYIGAFVFLALYSLYDLITQFKKHPVSASIWLTLIGTFMFMLVVGLMLSDQPFATSLREDFIPESTESLLARVLIWRYARELLFGMYWGIGHGFGISNALLATAISVDMGTPTNRFHNGWLEIAATGGLVGFFFYLVAIGFLVYFIVKRYKNNPHLATTILFIIIGVLIQSIAEAKVFFKADAMGTLGTFIIVVPLLLNPELIDQKVIVRHLPKTFDIYRL